MKTVTFRQLRVFTEVARNLSFVRAAEALHLTPPAVTMQVKELESAIELPLFDRQGRKVTLTTAGEYFLVYAKRLLATLKDADDAMARFRKLETGMLSVGLVSTAKYFVPRLLGGFCAQYPDIDIRLEVLNRDGVVQRLREQRDDLAIMSMPPADLALDDAVFLSNPLVLIASAGHALTQRGALTLDDLREERFILRERGSGTRMAADAHFRAAGFRPNLRLELGSNEAIKEAVAGGLGLSVLSAHTLHGRAREHGVQVLPVAGFPISGQWHVVHRQGRALSPVARVFRAHLLSQAARVAAEVAAER